MPSKAASKTNAKTWHSTASGLRSVCLAVLLLGCEATPTETAPEEPPALPEISVIEQETAIPSLPSEEEQLIADLLFEGLQALDDDRLLTPIDDNAHARFSRVLAYQPDNELALQGLQDIVSRYLELARQNILLGLFEEAQDFIDRARFVDGNASAIRDVELQLQQERDSGDLFFQLDENLLASQSDEVRARLAEIAELARQHDAFCVITAPSDAMARWMYLEMRASLDGYRLRGIIDIASRATIRLRMPTETP